MASPSSSSPLGSPPSSPSLSTGQNGLSSTILQPSAATNGNAFKASFANSSSSSESVSHSSSSRSPSQSYTHSHSNSHAPRHSTSHSPHQPSRPTTELSNNANPTHNSTSNTNPSTQPRPQRLTLLLPTNALPVHLNRQLRYHGLSLDRVTSHTHHPGVQAIVGLEEFALSNLGGLSWDYVGVGPGMGSSGGSPSGDGGVGGGGAGGSKPRGGDKPADVLRRLEYATGMDVGNGRRREMGVRGKVQAIMERLRAERAQREREEREEREVLAWEWDGGEREMGVQVKGNEIKNELGEEEGGKREDEDDREGEVKMELDDADDDDDAGGNAKESRQHDIGAGVEGEVEAEAEAEGSIASDGASEQDEYDHDHDHDHSHNHEQRKLGPLTQEERAWLDVKFAELDALEKADGERG